MTADPALGPEPGAGSARWTFLTHHAQVLLAVARDPDARVADIAELVGISRRAVLSVLADLEEAGYLVRRRAGRRTHYELTEHRPLRHPAQRGHEVDEILALLGEAPARRPTGPT